MTQLEAQAPVPKVIWLFKFAISIYFTVFLSTLKPGSYFLRMGVLSKFDVTTLISLQMFCKS